MSVHPHPLKSLSLTSITGWTNCYHPIPGSQSSLCYLEYLSSGAWLMETSSQSVALVICMDHGGCSLLGCLFGEQSRTFSRESVSSSRGREAGEGHREKCPRWSICDVKIVLPPLPCPSARTCLPRQSSVLLSPLLRMSETGLSSVIIIQIINIHHRELANKISKKKNTTSICQKAHTGMHTLS